MSKIVLLIEALYKGRQLANSAAWKNSAILASFLGTAFALGRAFGYDLGLSDEHVASIAGAVLLLVNGYVHMATSKSVGLKAKG